MHLCSAKQKCTDPQKLPDVCLFQPHSAAGLPHALPAVMLPEQQTKPSMVTQLVVLVHADTCFGIHKAWAV